MSNLVYGTITGYNSQTKTCEVTTLDGALLQNVLCPVDKYDEDSKSVKFTPPSDKTPVLCASVNGRNMIVRMYPPRNLSTTGSSDATGLYGSYVNYSAFNDVKEQMPGTTIDRNGKGGTESFDDNGKQIIIAPGKLSTTWNIINNTYDTICTQYNIRSAAMDIKSEADGGDAGNTTITFRRSVGEDPGCVTINIGSDASVLDIKICGKDFLHVDESKNVKLDISNMDIIATGNINISAAEVNCLNVGSVKLP